MDKVPKSNKIEKEVKEFSPTFLAKKSYFLHEYNRVGDQWTAENNILTHVN